MLKPPPGGTILFAAPKHTLSDPDVLLSAGRHSCVAAIFACPRGLATLLWPLQQQVRMRSCALNVEPILLPMRKAPAEASQVELTEATSRRCPAYGV